MELSYSQRIAMIYAIEQHVTLGQYVPFIGREDGVNNVATLYANPPVEILDSLVELQLLERSYSPAFKEMGYILTPKGIEYIQANLDSIRNKRLREMVSDMYRPFTQDEFWRASIEHEDFLTVLYQQRAYNNHYTASRKTKEIKIKQGYEEMINEDTMTDEQLEEMFELGLLNRYKIKLFGVNELIPVFFYSLSYDAMKYLHRFALVDPDTVAKRNSDYHRFQMYATFRYLSEIGKQYGIDFSDNLNNDDSDDDRVDF